MMNRTSDDSSQFAQFELQYPDPIGPFVAINESSSPMVLPDRSSESMIEFPFRHLLLLMVLSLVILAGCTPSNTSVRDSDEVDAVEAAKTITQNRIKALSLDREVMDLVDVEDEESVRKGLEKYKQAENLLDESVRLAGSSTKPRLDRFDIRNKIASGYTVLYVMADAECTPLEDEGLRPSEPLLRKRAEAKKEAERWLKLARRDMETHLGNTPVQYQTPEQYWQLQLVYVQLADFNGARTTLLRLLDNHGNRLSGKDRKEIDSRIRYFAQKLLDEGN